MACYHYTLRGFSPDGSICLSGVITSEEAITLEELVQKIETASGESLDPASSGAVLMVNDLRVDWDTGRIMTMRDGDRLISITPAFGG